VALGTTAPVESATVPVRAAVFWAWRLAVPQARIRRARTPTKAVR
jgi:hypothetical protein